MFFDTSNKDDVYENYLVSIAKKQKELLLCRFDTETRTVKEFVATGFLRKKSPMKDLYNKLLGELELLKEQTISHRKSKGYSYGTFWWNLPWNQIENYLLYDLIEITEDGQWRFEYTWRTENLDRNFQQLLLLEEGHYSNFSSSNAYNTARISAYSASEQAEMVRKFNNRQNTYALADLSLNNNAVHSTLSGQDYASKADYYLSSEYYFTRQYMSDSYARSLYTERETTGITAYSSNSRHYKCVYGIASYHVSERGVLDYISIDNFRYCGGNGDIDDDIKNQYKNKDAAVACAFYLANCSDIKQVPLDLFGINILKGAPDHDELIRQAEIFTCLADKVCN